MPENRMAAATFDAPSFGASGVFSFDAADVTGTHELSVTDLQRSLPAGAVAKALAARMSLPENVPWSLHDAQGAFLADDEPIGEQISEGSKVTLAPKTHLG